MAGCDAYLDEQWHVGTCANSGRHFSHMCEEKTPVSKTGVDKDLDIC